MFIFLTAPPFNGSDDYEILESVKRGIYKFEDEEWENVSKEAKELIGKMLERGNSSLINNSTDPKKRITTE